MRKAKLLAVLCAAVMIFSPMICSAQTIVHGTENAPAIDGVINKNEYSSQEKYSARGWGSVNTDGKSSAVLYTAWDAECLYLAVKAPCTQPHSAYNSDEHYIYNGHHLLITLLPDDPSKEVYKPANGEYDAWSESLADSILEFAVIADSQTSKTVYKDYFGALTSLADFECAAKSTNSYDYYEIKIPLSALKTVNNGNTAVKGEAESIIGISLQIGCSDIGNGYDGENGVYRGSYIYYGGSYGDYRGKNLSAAAQLLFKPQIQATPQTGDEGNSPLIVIAVIAVFLGIAAVVFKGRGRRNDDDEDDNEK